MMIRPCRKLLLTVVLISGLAPMLPVNAYWGQGGDSPVEAMMWAMTDLMNEASRNRRYGSGYGYGPGYAPGYAPGNGPGYPAGPYPGVAPPGPWGGPAIPDIPYGRDRWVDNLSDYDTTARLQGQWYNVNGLQLELRGEEFMLASPDGGLIYGLFNVHDDHIQFMMADSNQYEDFSFLFDDDTLLLKGRNGLVMAFERPGNLMPYAPDGGEPGPGWNW